VNHKKSAVAAQKHFLDEKITQIAKFICKKISFPPPKKKLERQQNLQLYDLKGGEKLPRPCKFQNT
jgi:hypothetical protein